MLMLMPFAPKLTKSVHCDQTDVPCCRKVLIRSAVERAVKLSKEKILLRNSNARKTAEITTEIQDFRSLTSRVGQVLANQLYCSMPN